MFLRRNLIIATIVVVASAVIKVEGQLAIGEKCDPESGLFCKLYDNTVACIEGTCQCNVPEDTVFDEGHIRCVGLVGSMCFAEKSFSHRECTPNADCFPDQDGDGHVVGKCECLYGFKDVGDGKCIREDGIGDDMTSTMRVTTTTKKPKFPDLYLPNITLSSPKAEYNESCNMVPLIGFVQCNTHDSSVSCINNKCLCNLGEDAEFHEDWKLCVGKVGSMCFLEANSIGRKVCTENADCFTDKPGHNVGSCECLYGYIEDPNTGKCVVNPSTPEGDRSTIRPTTPRPTLPPRPATTTTVTEDPSGPTSGPTAASTNKPNTATSAQSSCYALLITSIYFVTFRI